MIFPKISKVYVRKFHKVILEMPEVTEKSVLLKFYLDGLFKGTLMQIWKSSYMFASI